MKVRVITNEPYVANLSDEVKSSIQNDLDSGFSMAEVIANAFTNLAERGVIHLEDLSYTFNLPYMKRVD